MCAASRGIGFPTQSGEIRRKSLGPPTYLEAKAEGDNSMSVKRLRSESVVGLVPQGPCDKVKAVLLEPQSPDGVSPRPPVERLQPGATRCTGLNWRPAHLRWVDDDRCGHLRERTGHLSRARTSYVNGTRDGLRGESPMVTEPS